MRSATVRLTSPDRPIRLIPSEKGAEHGFTRGPFRHADLLSDGSAVALRSVDGNDGAYRDLVAAHPDVHEAVVSEEDPGIVYVHFDPAPATRQLLDWRRETELVVEAPILVEDDNTLVVTFVGDPGAFADELATLPSWVETEVVSTGTYSGRDDAFFEPLTRTQRRVLSAAVELNYYAHPREATQADLAAELDLAPSTVAEHLQKIEAALLSRFEAETS